MYLGASRRATASNSKEVGPFFARFGFEQMALLWAESLTVGLEMVLPELLAGEALRQLVFELAIGHAGDPSTLGLARHLLYVGRCRSAGPRPRSASRARRRAHCCRPSGPPSGVGLPAIDSLAVSLPPC